MRVGGEGDLAARVIHLAHATPRIHSVQCIADVGKEVGRRDPAVHVPRLAHGSKNEIAVRKQRCRLLLELQLDRSTLLERQRGLVDQSLLFRLGEVSCQQGGRQLANLRTENLLEAAERGLAELKPMIEAAVDAIVDRAGMDKVPDRDGLRRLAEAVDAPDPLFDPHRIPGQVVIDHHAAELKVDALAADF